MIIKQEKYNGDFIHGRFAYEQFRKEVSPVGNVVAFRAPMDVKENLIDLEDTLTDDFIASEDAINFCWEIPNLGPLGAVSFQRLFNTEIAKFLSKRINAPIEMDGDDLMVQKLFVGSDGEAREKGKVSVMAGQKAPGFAFSSELSDEEAQAFMHEVIEYFNAEVKDQFVATTKIVV